MARRLVLTGDHVCEWREFSPARPGPTQVQVKTELASGKYGTWAAMIDSTTFGEERLDDELRVFRPVSSANKAPPPTEIAIGTMATGIVMEAGSQVRHIHVGDRVVVLGGDIRDINTASADDIRPLGKIEPRLAMCVEPSYVSFHCVRESNVRYGDTVVVVGLGALGLIAVHMARQSGAAKVVAIDLLSGRRKLAEKLGADFTLDPRDGDPAIQLRERLGSPHGADVAIELGGSTAALNTAIRCARVAGTVCAGGFYRGEARGLFLGKEAHHNRLSIIIPHGCGFGHPARDYPRWDRTRTFDTLLDQMRSGRLAVGDIVNPIVNVDEATDLFRRTRDEPDRIVKFAVQF